MALYPHTNLWIKLYLMVQCHFTYVFWVIPVTEPIWDECQAYLKDELTAQQFNTWIRPLKANYSERAMSLFAPNRFVKDWVKTKFLNRIEELTSQLSGQRWLVDIEVSPTSGLMRHRSRYASQPPSQASSSISPAASFASSDRDASDRLTSTPLNTHQSLPESLDSSELNPDSFSAQGGDQYLKSSCASQAIARPSKAVDPNQGINETAIIQQEAAFLEPQLDLLKDADVSVLPVDIKRGTTARKQTHKERKVQVEGSIKHQSFLNPNFTFDGFVEGKSNQLAHAAAQQVAQNTGGSYNPLFIYGGVGLGKTHLMQAVGNAIVQYKPNAKVVYLHSERFVADMVKALQLNAINEFKRYYRSVDALLIDDIQFFAGKERSQEEFFHTFNALLEGRQQIILTCDRYPKDIDGLEDRLKSRFGWGLTVAVEPPELETRVAILMKKAEQENVDFPHEAAFFVAQKIRSNVRELEGALKRVIANAEFTGAEITLPFIKESLKDLLASHEKQVSIDNIQRIVADYFKLKVSDLLSKRRTRSIARPRQLAMALSKELTNHSLPEIGDAFGGRDHTTVLHACRKIRELNESHADIREDYNNLFRSLTT